MALWETGRCRSFVTCHEFGLIFVTFDYPELNGLTGPDDSAMCLQLRYNEFDDIDRNHKADTLCVHQGGRVDHGDAIVGVYQRLTVIARVDESGGLYDGLLEHFLFSRN